ncbi:MAG: class I SAM-dependent methyltransferase [Novosphingobium sp.]
MGGVPILIDFAASIVTRDAVMTLAPEPPEAKAGGIGARLYQLAYGAPSEMMPVYHRELEKLAEATGERLRILIIGGGTLAEGEDELEQAARYEVVRTDIYLGPNVDIVCDGHALPFADASFDAVLCQAVIEHVLDPAQVVNEIHRVLRRGGLVAAETSFMQQVHMDAYDFTRFTVSGHRWLFRRFEEVAADIRGGAGLSLIWSIGILARSLRLGRKGAAIATALFAWVKLADRFGLRKLREDGANGVWFVGRASDAEMKPADMVRYYEDRRARDG